MKILWIAIALSFSLLTSLFAEALSAKEKAKLMEKLDNLFEKSEERTKSRTKAALSAFNQGRKNDEAALDLYLNCVEKSQFLDEKKTGNDFREWKRAQAERFKKDGFALALRHQLNWLYISMRSQSEDQSASQTAVDALKAITTLVEQIALLEKQNKVLTQNVYSTVFAKTYKIQAPKKTDLPTSPLPIKSVYEKVIFPSVKKTNNTAALRSAWVGMIQQEKRLEEAKSLARSNKETSPAFDRFITEKLPSLRWAMEKDLFAEGDEEIAANNMYKLIVENVTHPHLKKWVVELQTLLEPEEADTSLTENQKAENDSQ